MIRIFSDIHYGDKASGVVDLKQLLPLFEGAEHIILNGDTLDTRVSPNPTKTDKDKAEVIHFTTTLKLPVSCITGNHDPDISDTHHLEFASGQIVVMHGDLAFDNIVPWGKDAPLLKKQIINALALLRDPITIEQKLQVYREISKALPQGHQAEKNLLKYSALFLRDTAWPPWRLLFMLKAWKDMPSKIARLVTKERPAARYIIVGHTHLPGFWTTRHGVTVINTGSFCPPLGCACVEITKTKIIVRHVTRRAKQYYLGKQLSEFALAH
jgi:predicted phosphodiesterase